MIRRTKSFLVVVAGLMLASNQNVDAQIFARLPKDQMPNASCGPNFCPPRIESYGYHAEVWRRWPGHAVALEELDLSPFASPTRSDVPATATPDPRDEDSVTAPPRDGDSGSMSMSPIAPSTSGTEAPSVAPPSDIDNGFSTGLPDDMSDDLPPSPGSEALPELDDSGSGGGLDDFLPDSDSLDTPADADEPLNVPSPNSDNLDDFLNDFGQNAPPQPGIDGSTSSRRTATTSQRATVAANERGNPLRDLGQDITPATAEATESQVAAATFEDSERNPNRGPYQPRRQTTMRGVDDLPPRQRRAGDEYDGRATGADWQDHREGYHRDQPAPPRYAEEYYRSGGVDGHRPPSYRPTDAPRGYVDRGPVRGYQEPGYQDRTYRDRGHASSEYGPARHDSARSHSGRPSPEYRPQSRAPEYSASEYNAPEYRDQRYHEGEFRDRRDRFVDNGQRRIARRRSVNDPAVRATAHEEATQEESPTTGTQTTSSGRVNPLRAGR